MPEELEKLSRDELKDELYSVAKEAYDLREAMFGADGMRELEKVVMLKVVDSKWIEHLDHMDMLREGITLRAYGQRDPLIEYKIEAFDMFERMIANIQEEIARTVFQVNIVVQPEDHLKDAKEVHADISAEEDSKKPVVNGETTGRNDLCPCGSGKKFKKCCGAENK